MVRAMIVLVCGGRSYHNVAKIDSTLRELGVTFVMEGGADGADRHARDYCMRNGIPCFTAYAPWSSPLLKAAGPVRNGWMLKYGPNFDRCVAFPGGKGTDNMVAQAQKAGVPIMRVT